MTYKKINLPKGFHEADENWKNSIHSLDFETADNWYNKRKLMIPQGEEEHFVDEESYYYQLAVVYIYEKNDLIKSSKICFRAFEKGLRSERILNLKDEIELKINQPQQEL
jgi:hypothetical protein